MSGNTKAMEEALQAAVTRMNKPAGGGGSGLTDPLGVIAAVLPKLLENRGEREDIGEKIDGLRTEDIAPLREQMQLVRKKLHRLGKAQEEMMGALDQLRAQQTAIGDAVLELVQQMARVEILDGVPDDMEPEVRAPERRSAAPSRRPARAAKTPQRVRKNGYEPS